VAATKKGSAKARPRCDFAVLPQVTVDAAAVVKKVLDAAYGAGRLRRSDYQQIVVAVVNHVLQNARKGSGYDGSTLTSDLVRQLQEAASACLLECFSRYVAETEYALPSQATRKKTSEDDDDINATRGPYVTAELQRAPVLESREVIAGTQADNGEGPLGEAATSNGSNEDVTFEDQVANLKKILHASLDSFPEVDTAFERSLPGVRSTSSLAKDATGNANTVEEEKALKAKRQALLQELRSLQDEAGLLQAKMNIVLRELTELA
jgi:hypothetical protein